VSWAIHSTYHTILEAFLGTAIFGHDMLFDIPYIADWNKGDYRQHHWCQVLVRKNGILRKTYSLYDSEPWTIMSVHTNEKIRVARGNKSHRINIRRVMPYFEHKKIKSTLLEAEQTIPTAK
jgi:hypothetical protein